MVMSVDGSLQSTLGSQAATGPQSAVSGSAPTHTWTVVPPRALPASLPQRVSGRPNSFWLGTHFTQPYAKRLGSGAEFTAPAALVRQKVPAAQHSGAGLGPAQETAG